MIRKVRRKKKRISEVSEMETLLKLKPVIGKNYGVGFFCTWFPRLNVWENNEIIFGK